VTARCGQGPTMREASGRWRSQANQLFACSAGNRPLVSIRWQARRSRSSLHLQRSLSLLKNPSGHGIGLPMKAMLMISVIRIERCSLATQSPCMGSERACIRATQLRTATTPGTATAVQVQSPQTVQAARRSERWCRPPTCEKVITVPAEGGCMGRGSGQSLLSERCVLLWW
jgi:hypothetical protein